MIKTLVIPPVIRLEKYSVDGDKLIIPMPDDVRRNIHDWTTCEVKAATIGSNPDPVSDIEMKNALSLGHNDEDGNFIGCTQASLMSAIATSKNGAWEEEDIRRLLRSMEKITQERLPTVRYIFKTKTIGMTG